MRWQTVPHGTVCDEPSNFAKKVHPVPLLLLCINKSTNDIDTYTRNCQQKWRQSSINNTPSKTVDSTDHTPVDSVSTESCCTCPCLAGAIFLSDFSPSSGDTRDFCQHKILIQRTVSSQLFLPLWHYTDYIFQLNLFFTGNLTSYHCFGSCRKQTDEGHSNVYCGNRRNYQSNGDKMYSITDVMDSHWCTFAPWETRVSTGWQNPYICVSSV